MFGLYFGNYLMEKNKISKTQFNILMQLQQTTHVKLGFIAVSERLLTNRQADEINDIQKKMDRRFGDIAIEKGYLLTEEVHYLLNMQGNPYLQFLQICAENDILTPLEIETYLEQFKIDNGFTTDDLDALKSGDIDRIIRVFVDVNTPICGEYLSLAIRNIVRFIGNNIIIKNKYTSHSYSFGNLASQKMVGDHEIFTGLACQKKELLNVANPFAQEEFTEMEEDAFDSVCEFINCTNGIYASKLSHENIQIDMTPPLYYKDKELTTQGEICVVPLFINGEQADLIVVVDSNIGII